MTNDESKIRPAIVTGPTQAQQAGDLRDRWGWIEPSVWTDRLLTRLEPSEPTTAGFGLWDKGCPRRNLHAACWAVGRNEGAPGVDGQTVRQFDEHPEAELARMGEERRPQRYCRQPARRVNDFAESSYGFRPGRGCREAVGRVEERLSQGHVGCVDCDLKSYCDTIPHDRRMALIQQRIVDGSVRAMMEQCLKAGVLEELKGEQPTERGPPQGAVISPMLAHLYRNPLDPERGRRGWARVRYADDFVVLCLTQEEAETVLNDLRRWTTAAGLTLHPTQTRMVEATSEGFDFLSGHFREGEPDPAGLVRLLPGQPSYGPEGAGGRVAPPPPGVLNAALRVLVAVRKHLRLVLGTQA